MIEDDAVVRFAGEDLERILRVMNGATEVVVSREDPAPEPETLVLTCDVDGEGIGLPEVADRSLDDAILIEVRDRRGGRCRHESPRGADCGLPLPLGAGVQVGASGC